MDVTSYDSHFYIEIFICKTGATYSDMKGEDSK